MADSCAAGTKTSTRKGSVTKIVAMARACVPSPGIDQVFADNTGHATCAWIVLRSSCASMRGTFGLGQAQAFFLLANLVNGQRKAQRSVVIVGLIDGPAFEANGQPGLAGGGTDAAGLCRGQCGGGAGKGLGYGQIGPQEAVVQHRQRPRPARPDPRATPEPRATTPSTGEATSTTRKGRIAQFKTARAPSCGAAWA